MGGRTRGVGLDDEGAVARREGRIIGLFGISRDITEKKRTEHRLADQAAQLGEQAERLERMTLVDELTGLNNRRGLQTLGEQALYQARRDGTSVALLFLDLDGLKQINDLRGHGAGDDALRAIAGVIRDSVRESDIAARIGGDEFCVLLFDRAGESVAKVADRITVGTAAARKEHSFPFPLSVSIGACEVDARTPGSIDELLRLADHSMYEDKTHKARAGLVALRTGRSA